MKCAYYLVASPRKQFSQGETIQSRILIYPVIFLLVQPDFMLCLGRAYSQFSLILSGWNQIQNKELEPFISGVPPIRIEFLTTSSLTTSECDCLLPLFMKLSCSMLLMFHQIAITCFL